MNTEVVEITTREGITKSRYDYDALTYVARARSTDHERPVLHDIHVEDVACGKETSSAAVATDGKRLHAAILRAPIKPGNYKMMLRTINRIVLCETKPETNYPQWRDVIPKLTHVTACETITTSFAPLSHYMMCVMAHRLHGSIFNSNLLRDAMFAATGLHLYQKDEVSPIYIANGMGAFTPDQIAAPTDASGRAWESQATMCAVIMPMKKD